MKYGGREVRDDKNGHEHVVCVLIFLFLYSYMLNVTSGTRLLLLSMFYVVDY